jgi:hydroxyacid-oxoacid transhydrogenase
MSWHELSHIRKQYNIHPSRIPSRSSNHPTYPPSHPTNKDGVSVAVTAPSVFRFTAPADPRRHLQAAEVFGVDISTAKEEDAGDILSDAVREFLLKLGDQPRGIKALGYERSHIPALVEGTLPQRRVLNLAPSPVARDDLESLFEEAMVY